MGLKRGREGFLAEGEDEIIEAPASEAFTETHSEIPAVAFIEGEEAIFRVNGVDGVEEGDMGLGLLVCDDAGEDLTS